MTSNISNGVNHREAARSAAKRAEVKGDSKTQKKFLKEMKNWQEQINGWREELQSL
ncbi:hypothetical protein WAF17_02590 [Bernardetia sp. ABR2-2B]|uniref:hypothetical protein n=1 Tax=Bernardetia sp. ABR2-2B TaxID=3127472 RepID=UPI0030D3932A